MKKVLCAMIALILCLVISSIGLAEAAMNSEAVQVVEDAQVVSLDWSGIVTEAVVWIIGFVASVILALIVFVMKKYVIPIVIPWLQEKNLMGVATAAVRAAEAYFGRFLGEEKWQYAIESLKRKGFDINEESVIEALKAAWKTLDIEQIAAGIKQADEGSKEKSEIIN